jgi:glycerol uptake facilitator-like aquaporin
VYHDAIHAYDGGHHTLVGPNATGKIFATYPEPYLTVLGGIVDQVVGTAVLLAAIFAMIDTQNPLAPAPSGLPFAVGAIVTAIGSVIWIW